MGLGGKITSLKSCGYLEYFFLKLPKFPLNGGRGFAHFQNAILIVLNKTSGSLELIVVCIPDIDEGQADSRS